jgi:hypothetical protein
VGNIISEFKKGTDYKRQIDRTSRKSRAIGDLCYLEKLGEVVAKDIITI